MENKKTLHKYGKVAVLGTVLLVLGGCRDWGREEPILIAHEQKTHQTQVNAEVKEEPKAEYLGRIELEDYNPDLPTQRREGKYTPGKQEGGVWEWEFEPTSNL